MSYRPVSPPSRVVRSAKVECDTCEKTQEPRIWDAGGHYIFEPDAKQEAISFRAKVVKLARNEGAQAGWRVDMRTMPGAVQLTGVLPNVHRANIVIGDYGYTASRVTSRG